ncbi:hypothetical protein [uncultured Corynebacterium sp.]|uniref:hypothetical protein n=1 Tax=uncultured Corynebacterium sp. TaxID=159447 RepID=UPI0025F298FA|nr:hypothetical protein [uncultured Corynebacterium sp.]
MRIPAAIVAASLTLTPATPAEPVEQLLDDVSATHETSITAINSAETDDEVRDVLVAWRKELIAASDELAELREEAAEDGLTEEEKDTFDDAAKTLKRERAGVRELRSELLPDDEPVVVPSPIEGLGGILGTTAIDAFERSEAGDAPIVYGIPGSDADRAEPTVTSVTKPTVAEEPTVVEEPTTTPPSTTSATFDPEVTHRVERLQDSDTESTTTETTTTETMSETTSTTTESATSTTTDASATTTATTSTSSTSSSSTRSVLENRTTSATSSSTTSSSSSTTSSSSKTSSTTTTEDDDERDGDLADTGTPMRALIAIGMLSLMIGAALVLTGAIRPRGARK